MWMMCVNGCGGRFCFCGLGCCCRNVMLWLCGFCWMWLVWYVSWWCSCVGRVFMLVLRILLLCCIGMDIRWWCFCFVCVIFGIWWFVLFLLIVLGSVSFIRMNVCVLCWYCGWVMWRLDGLVCSFGMLCWCRSGMVCGGCGGLCCWVGMWRWMCCWVGWWSGDGLEGWCKFLVWCCVDFVLVERVLWVLVFLCFRLFLCFFLYGMY